MVRPPLPPFTEETAHEKVRLTEAGSRFFEDCRKIIADVEEAEAAASGS